MIRESHSTSRKIEITTVHSHTKVHAQFSLRITCMNESAHSVLSLKFVLVSLLVCPFDKAYPTVADRSRGNFRWIRWGKVVQRKS